MFKKSGCEGGILLTTVILDPINKGQPEISGWPCNKSALNSY